MARFSAIKAFAFSSKFLMQFVGELGVGGGLGFPHDDIAVKILGVSGEWLGDRGWYARPGSYWCRLRGREHGVVGAGLSSNIL